MLIYTRNNWKWYCKQVLNCDKKPLKSLIWLKKYQLCLVHENSYVAFVEYNFTCLSSMSVFNHAKSQKEEFGYAAVVDGQTVHLTPLGKFLMPPPMSEKQIALPAFPTSLSLYGHHGVAYADTTGKFYSFECVEGQASLKELDAESNHKITSAQNFTKAGVSYIQAVENAPSSDSLVLYKVQDAKLTEIARVEVGQGIQRVSLGARISHSGYDTKDTADENSEYLSGSSTLSAPLAMMGFGQSLGAGEDDISLTFVVQLTDKSVKRFKIEAGETFFEEEEMFDMPYPCIKL